MAILAGAVSEMALWTPADITTALWIDFADQSTLFDATSGGSVVTNGVGIARAEDKSGNGRNFTEGTSGNRPTWNSGVQNGLGVARYDGNDRLTSVAASSTWTFLHSSQSTIFVVVKNGTTSDPNAAYGIFGTNPLASSNIGFGVFYDDRAAVSRNNALVGGATRAVLDSFVSLLVTQNFVEPNAFEILEIASDPANSTAGNRLKFANNGSSLSGANTATGAINTANPTNNLQIGTAGNNTLPLTGDYCELIIAPSLLSTADRQNTEGYLAHKWGLTASLPSDHPYKTTPPGFVFPRRRRSRSGGGVL
jgi:hypothetical protein